MPWGLIIKWVITLAVQFGLPYALAWLHQRFPFLPASVDAVIQKLIEALEGAKEQTQAAKAVRQQAKKKAIAQLHQCLTGCPPDVIKE